jgi:hypothetical protein
MASLRLGEWWVQRHHFQHAARVFTYLKTCAGRNKTGKRHICDHSIMVFCDQNWVEWPMIIFLSDCSSSRRGIPSEYKICTRSPTVISNRREYYFPGLSQKGKLERRHIIHVGNLNYQHFTSGVYNDYSSLASWNFHILKQQSKLQKDQWSA